MHIEIHIEMLEEKHINDCVDLFIDVFSKEPWNDVYESRNQVITFFENYLADNYFLGYVLINDGKLIGLCLGAKKPWINGMEYYIDQFCIDPEYQGQNIGGLFLKEIESDICEKKLNAIILYTERGMPAEKFYLKNGFNKLDELVFYAK